MLTQLANHHHSGDFEDTKYGVSLFGWKCTNFGVTTISVGKKLKAQKPGTSPSRELLVWCGWSWCLCWAEIHSFRHQDRPKETKISRNIAVVSLTAVPTEIFNFVFNLLAGVLAGTPPLSKQMQETWLTCTTEAIAHNPPEIFHPLRNTHSRWLDRPLSSSGCHISGLLLPVSANVVEVLGKKNAIDLMHETEMIEAQGGMMTNVSFVWLIGLAVWGIVHCDGWALLHQVSSLRKFCCPVQLDLKKWEIRPKTSVLRACVSCMCVKWATFPCCGWEAGRGWGHLNEERAAPWNRNAGGKAAVVLDVVSDHEWCFPPIKQKISEQVVLQRTAIALAHCSWTHFSFVKSCSERLELAAWHWHWVGQSWFHKILPLKDNARRRTPGGVFLQLLKFDCNLTSEQLKQVFGEERANEHKERWVVQMYFRQAICSWSCFQQVSHLAARMKLAETCLVGVIGIHRGSVFFAAALSQRTKRWAFN